MSSVQLSCSSASVHTSIRYSFPGLRGGIVKYVEDKETNGETAVVVVIVGVGAASNDMANGTDALAVAVDVGVNDLSFDLLVAPSISSRARLVFILLSDDSDDCVVNVDDDDFPPLRGVW